MKHTKIALIIFTLGFIVFFSSCYEEEPLIVPDVHVNFTINLELSQYISLKVEGNSYKVLYEGYDDNGVIIFRNTQPINSPEAFLAFDATCPQHVSISTAIIIDGRVGTCPHCNTTYFFEMNGYPNKGYPLKRYKTILNGTMLTVRN
jgi:hypothetical protein